MIHDEFAFDGYLDDGVEDLNMGKNCLRGSCSTCIGHYLTIIQRTFVNRREYL